MKATVANMKRILAKHGEKIAVPGIVAYSPVTGETCSASPGDYFFMGDNECLFDSDGVPMVLARRVPERFVQIN